MLWLVVGVVLVVVTVVQLVALTRALVGGDLPPLGTGGLFLGFAVTVVWLLTISWFALGCWRRSVWGCPFSHTEETPPARRCARHPLVDGPTETPGGHDGAGGGDAARSG